MNLKELRKARGLSQEQLAELVPDMDHSMISRLESGERPMSAKSASALGSVLGVNPAGIRVENLAVVLKMAIDRDDAPAVLEHTTAILEATEGQDLSREGEQVIEALYESALTYAEKVRGSGSSLLLGEPELPFVSRQT